MAEVKPSARPHFSATAQPRWQGNDKGQRGKTLGIGRANCRQVQRSIIQSPHLTAYN